MTESHEISLNWLREFVELPNDPAGLGNFLRSPASRSKASKPAARTTIAWWSRRSPPPRRTQRRSPHRLPGRGWKRPCAADRLRRKKYQVATKSRSRSRARSCLTPEIRASKLPSRTRRDALQPKRAGASDDSAGLLILSPEARIGAPIGELFRPDSILTLKSRRIVPICSALRLAREIAA